MAKGILRPLGSVTQAEIDKFFGGSSSQIVFGPVSKRFGKRVRETKPKRRIPWGNILTILVVASGLAATALLLNPAEQLVVYLGLGPTAIAVLLYAFGIIHR